MMAGQLTLLRVGGYLFCIKNVSVILTVVNGYKSRGGTLMTINLLVNKEGTKISKYLYGQFSEHLGRGIYEGIYVGENSDIPNVNGMRTDVVSALKDIHVPVLRWPGGLFADTYNWRDGIGPKNQRKKIVNTNWGNVTEDNSFGTHEYFELLDQIGAEPYIAVNMGSGSIREMAEWVEYVTMPGQSPMADLRRKNGRQEPWKLRFLGIGNEAWGGGGQMRPEFYSDLYRRYQSFVPQYDDAPMYKVACGPSEDDYEWTDKVMQIAGPFLDGLSLHYYTLPAGEDWQSSKTSATGFSEELWWRTIDRTKKMDEIITKHSAIMDKYDPEQEKNLVIDEWGTWYDVEKGTNPGFLYQQNTIRDAMVAAINLNIFHKHAKRLYMANIAQTVNVLQAMLLTDGDQMIKTPTYYVFDMYQNHMDAEFVEGFGEMPANVSYTASKKDGQLTISIVNYNLESSEELTFSFENQFNSVLSAKILTADEMDAHNTFDNPDKIHEDKITEYKLLNGDLVINVPNKSVVTIVLR